MVKVGAVGGDVVVLDVGTVLHPANQTDKMTAMTAGHVLKGRDASGNEGIEGEEAPAMGAGEAKDIKIGFSIRVAPQTRPPDRCWQHLLVHVLTGPPCPAWCAEKD